MEIIRKGVVLPEEMPVFEKLQSLPNSWWCIAGDNNRFTFKQGEGTQIDFIVISPKGIFIIDSKNIHTIEVVEGNTLHFYNADGKQIRKSKRRESPVEDIINEKYQTKDWLQSKGLHNFLTPDKKDLSVFIHGLVVIANDKSVIYKNCKLQNLSHYTHKYKSIIPIEELNKDYFNNIYLPANCKELSKEEMWVLFKIFYNPNLSIVEILNNLKKDSDKIFEEKQIFIEKMRLLEKENINTNKQIIDLEGTRNNLISLNQKLQDTITKIKDELSGQDNLLREKEKEKETLNKDIESFLLYKEKTKNYDKDLAKLKETSKKITLIEKENRRLSSLIKENKNLNILKKRLTKFKITTIIISTLLVFYLSYNIFNNNSMSQSKLVDNPSKIFTTIEELYPTIELLHNKEEFKNSISIWEKSLPETTSIILSKDFRKYDKIMYYIALAYLKTEHFEKAIKYFDTYSELIKNDSQLIETYINRSIAHIKLKTELDRAIIDLKKGLKINKQLFNDYNWTLQILWNLGMCYELILIDTQEAKQKYYANNLKVKDFYKETIKYFRRGRDVASANYDIISQANFQIEMGHIYKLKKNYRLSIEQFKEAIILLKSTENKKAETKERLMLSINALGGTYASINKNNIAKEYYKEALEINKANNIEESKKKIYKAQISRNLGALFLRTKQYKTALLYMQQALAIAEELNLPSLKTYQKEYEEGKRLYEAQ